MPDSKPKLTPLAFILLATLAGAIIYTGVLALGQFTPKCVSNAACPSLSEMILRAITVFFAGLMVLAGVGWWIVFNILPRFQREASPDDRKQEG